MYKSLSIRKYSCSGPTVGVTFLTSLPKSFKILLHCLSITSIERKSGVFLSRDSPLYEQNAVGIHKEPSFIKAYEVGSQAVYPRASHVARKPPDGKLEPSGSPFINSFPENSIITFPPDIGEMKLSCFSAVIPVIG